MTPDLVHETFEKAFDMPISDDASMRIADGIARIRMDFRYREE